jgi:diguanylate cyclase (GGDEF)-like protein
VRNLTLRPGWRTWLVVGALAVLGSSLVPPDVWYDNVVYDAIGAAAVLAIVVAVRRHRPADARIWYLFAAGQALWVCGDVTYAIYTYVLHQEPFPSAADAFYLCGYPLIAAGLFRMIRSRVYGRDLAGLLDAAIIATGLGVLAWEFLMRPVTMDDSLTVTARLIGVAYPAADVLLLVMLVRLLTVPSGRSASYRMLVGALVLVLCCDAAYTVWNTFFTYVGCPLDPGFLSSYVLWAAAALHPSMRSLSEVAPGRPPRFGSRRLAVLTGASLLAPVLLIVQGSTDPARIDWAGIAIGSVALFVLVLLRMYGLVSQVQDQAAQLAALAHNDALTGVPNRRSWDLELSRAMAAAHRTGTRIAVALIDLDHFKRFNDRYGHQAGDRLLVGSAAAWRAHLREGDFIARYGGEEFGVILPDTAGPAAREVLERMLGSTPEGRTFSAGLVVWDGAETPQELVGRADGMLYRAKDAGRARVVGPDPAQRSAPAGPRVHVPRHAAPEDPADRPDPVRPLAASRP